MLAFPSMLIGPAVAAGIKTPIDVDAYDRDKFIHFYIFCWLQLCRPMKYYYEHWDNAKVLAKFDEVQVRTSSPLHYILAGFTGLEYTPGDPDFAEEEKKALADLKEWGIL